MEDRQLLADYAHTGSEAAFAQRVERHLGLVHTAARRQRREQEAVTIPGRGRGDLRPG